MRFWILVFSCFFIASCALRHDIKPSGVEISPTQAEQIIEQINHRRPTSFRGLYHTSFEGSGQRGSLRHIMIARNRADITIQTIPTNSGMTLNQLNLKSEQLVFEDFINHQTIVNQANSNSLETMLGLRIAPEYFFDLIVGRLPLTVVATDSSLRSYFDSSQSLLTLIETDGTQAYRIDTKTGVLQKAVFNNPISKKFDFSIDYSENYNLSSYTVPTKLKVTSPLGTARLHLSIETFKPNF